MSTLIVLAFLLLILGVMVGAVKPRTLGKFVAWLLLAPVFLIVLLSVLRESLAGMSPSQQVLFLATVVIPALLICVAVLLRMVLPRDVWAGIVASFLYDVLKFLFGLPVRLVKRLYHLKH